MIKLTNEQIKVELTSLLEHFHKFCVQNNLNYSIAYGTLLGAHRHKGFIPWDDDIDVVMPEEDYQKLIELYKDSEKYSLKEISITQYYSYPYAKLNLNNTTIDSEFEQKIENLGLYIDIFPIYKSNPELVNSNLNKFRSYNRSIVMRKFEGNKNSLKGVLKTLISKVLFPKYLHNKKTIIKKTKKLLSKFKDDNSKFYHQFIWIGYAKQLYSFTIEQFNNKTLIDFENIKCYAISNYEDFLLSMYGPTYMELPPVEMRKAHNIIAYYKDSSK